MGKSSKERGKEKCERGTNRSGKVTRIMLISLLMQAFDPLNRSVEVYDNVSLSLSSGAFRRPNKSIRDFDEGLASRTATA